VSAGQGGSLYLCVALDLFRMRLHLLRKGEPARKVFVVLRDDVEHNRILTLRNADVDPEPRLNGTVLEVGEANALQRFNHARVLTRGRDDSGIQNSSTAKARHRGAADMHNPSSWHGRVDQTVYVLELRRVVWILVDVFNRSHGGTWTNVSQSLSGVRREG